MKYDLKQIMKRAWVIRKKNKRNIFGLCLKISWCEFKQALKDKVTNTMLNTYCTKVRPKYYRTGMSTSAILGLFKRNNITIPDDIAALL